jgi:hypothetical protein
VAATLEVRGFAGARRAARRVRPWSRHDVAFALSAGGVLLLAIAGSERVAFTAYPRIHIAMGVGTAVLCLALLAAICAPFADRRGIDP